MTRFFFLVIPAFLFSGCGDVATEPPDFQGRWRKYEDPNKRFVEFTDGRIVMGDKSDSQSGTFSFQLADDQEPLYAIRAEFSAGVKEFQLYFERDTISLIGLGNDQDGLYEIIFQSDPIEER